MNFLSNITRVHAIGAGGIGVSAIAKLLRHEGKMVTGSDAALNESTKELEELGISVIEGHAAKNLPESVDLVVYSDAVPANNPEREEARRRGIRQMSYFDFLGEYSAGKWTIAVSGTHGKSTTTAMLGLILERAGLDPTVIVGSKVSSFPDKNLRLGRGKYFVVEACEHHANMLKLAPQMIVLTRIEEDHLDFYRNLPHIRETFQAYIEKLPADGKLVLNADDSVCIQDLKPTTAVVSYGIDSPADYLARNISLKDGRQSFDILRTTRHEELLGQFYMQIPGRFNVSNALAAVSAAAELGSSVEAMRETVGAFPGIWRRFERMGEWRGATIVSDYGHHPTAVRETLTAAREFYPGRRVVLAFQPHQRNRTRKLWDDFVSSFDTADALVLAEIYDVAGREADEDRTVSSRSLVEAVTVRDAKQNIRREVAYASSAEETGKTLERIVKKGDVVIIMGAGDIYRLAERMCATMSV